MSSRHRDRDHDHDHDHDDESRRRHHHRHHHHSSSSSRVRDIDRERTAHISRASDKREERSSSRADESASGHHHRRHHHHHHRSSKDEGEERKDRGSRRGQREDSRSLSPDERRRRRRDDERDQDKSGGGGGVETAAFVHPSRAGLVPDARPSVVPDARPSVSREESSRHRRREDRSSSRHDEARSSRSSATASSRARSPRRALTKFSESPPPMQYEVINERMKREHPDTYMTSSADDDSQSRNRPRPRSTSAHGSEGEPEERQVPNYATSGALLGDKLYKGVSLQYAEPDDSRKPDKSYRFYVFKSGEIVDTVRLDQQSVYLLGRDRTIVDLPLDHPSISKQQAVVQFRLVVEEVGFLGETEDRVAPFVYDLGSANGTMVNGEKVKEREYVELKVKDMLTFGLSSREYLLMCEDEVEEKK